MISCLRCDAPATIDGRCDYHHARRHLDNQDGSGPIPARLIRLSIEELRRKAENVELACERAGLRDTKSRVYDARLRLSEALRSLPGSADR